MFTTLKFKVMIMVKGNGVFGDKVSSINYQIGIVIMHMLLKYFLYFYSLINDVNACIVKSIEKTNSKLSEIFNENKYSLDINLSGASLVLVGP